MRPAPLLRLLALIVAIMVAAGAASVRAASTPQSDEEEGRRLYRQGCASCHGVDGRGVTRDGVHRGPSLKRSGEAAAYYYLSTGRMPLANSDEQPRRKSPAFNQDEIRALVAYVASLGEGPELPDVAHENADIAEGGVLFRTHCAACHSAAGAGGALSYGRAAPNLHHSRPRQIAAAIRAGPGEMPVFGTEVLNREQVDDIVRYVRFLRRPDDRGGIPLGRIGPIPEGLVSWLIGVGALIGFVVWIGTRSPARPRSDS